MENNNFSLYSLLIVTLLAVIVPLVVSRIKAVRIPIVVGEILVGVLVGKSGFNIIQTSEWLQFLQFFGLAYLMFVSGLEIDLRALRPRMSRPADALKLRMTRFKGFWTNPLVFAVTTCTITFALAYGMSHELYIHHFIRSTLMVALIITTTSLTVVVPVLKEYDLQATSYGQLLLAAAVCADFVTMLLLSVAASLYKGGFSPSVLLVFVLITILFILYFVVRKIMKLLPVAHLLDGTAQLGIRASLALMIVFIVLSQTLGVQVILGTFLAGVFVGIVGQESRGETSHKLDAIGFGFLIPIFFIMVGVDFDVRSLLHDTSALILFPILLVMTYLFKGIPALLLRFSYGWRQTLAGSTLLTTQMSVTVAAAAVGLKIGAISTGVDTAIVLVAMLTSIISPVLFGKLLPPLQETPEKHIVVVGNAPELHVLVEQLKQRSEHVEWTQHLESSEEIAQSGGPASTHLYMDLHHFNIDLETTQAVLAYSNDDDANIALSEQAVAHGIPTVICRIQDLSTYQKYTESAKFLPVCPELSMVTLVNQWLHYPIATQLLESPSSMQLREVRLTNRAFNNVRLRDVRLPGGVLLASIVRDGAKIVPNGDTALKVGDSLVVVGETEALGDFQSLAKAKFRSIRLRRS